MRVPFASRPKFNGPGCVLALLTAGACTLGCGGGGASPVARPPPAPPPSSVSVSLTPGSATVLLGNTQSFTAAVSGTIDTAVDWTVNGIAGGSSSYGTITAAGVYSAPAVLPSPAAVTARATSRADNTKYAEANVTLASDVSLSLTPGAASVELGAVEMFHAVVSSNGHPDTGVSWSLTGASCPAFCGAIDAAGNYTAPRTLPSLASFTLTARFVADGSKKASASITITSTFALAISAPASVPAGGTATISATLQPAAGSNPATGIAWSLSGAGCSGSACGMLTGSSSSLVSGGATVYTITYTAPATPPNPAAITVTVTPAADPGRNAQAGLTIGCGAALLLTPASATRAAGQRLTLSAVSSGASSSTLNWSVNGIAGGDTTAGQICAAGSNPCQPVSATSAAQVDYLAPAAIPATNPVAVRAASQADPTISGSAQITIIAHVVVTVSPAMLTLPPAAHQQFFSTVLGTDNQNVVWQVSGAGCSGAGCGPIDANGIYTALLSAPSPASVKVLAISSADTSQSGQAAVSLSSGSAILGLFPGSVYAGGTAGFTLRALGSGFQPSNPGRGSALLVGGVARLTNCLSALECTAPLGADEVIALTASAPAAAGKDIVVVEPSSAASSLPGASLNLNVAALGLFSAANNTCALGGNALKAARPSSGSASLEICMFSWSGLDTGMTYTVSGAAGADAVTVISKQSAGLGIIHLTLQIPSSAAPGPRTIFVQKTNLDKAAASGALEVQ